MSDTPAAGSPTGSATGTPLAADTGLQSAALRLPGVLMQSITTVAPAIGMFFTIQFIASYAGIVAPLGYLLAFLIVLMLAASVSQLAKHLPNAGGYRSRWPSSTGARCGGLRCSRSSTRRWRSRSPR